MFLNYPTQLTAWRIHESTERKIIHGYKNVIIHLYGTLRKSQELNIKLKRSRGDIVPKLSLRDKLNDIFIKLTVALKVIHRENQN